MVATIISVIVSAIIAFFIAKWQMKKNRIAHYTINSYSIGKGLRDDFPEFELHYSGDTLSNDVRVLKGGFMNTGENDIENTDFTMILPDRCVVKAMKVTPITDNLIVKANVNADKKNTIQFVVDGIFIPNEYFEYTIIVEVQDGVDDLDDELSFQHRIKNTEKIKNTFVGEYQQEKKERKMEKIVHYLLPILFGVMLVTVLFSSICRPMRHKVFQKDSDKEVEVYITPQSKIIVANPNSFPNPFGESITSNDFDQHYRVELIKTFKWSFGEILMIIIMCIGLIAIIMLHLVGIDRSNHIIKVLEKTKKQEEAS